ncbi:MAG: hypothetical protein IPJ07_02830 [Acidobacteria bacterium]|nr:hypothetical protein [Acidobacteriota bacterium]
MITIMAKTTKRWKKGRGKLGVLDPLIGTWKAEAATPMGPMTCTRSFTRVLNSAYIQLTADWAFGKKSYQELAIIGVNPEGIITFWSFTSDGKTQRAKSQMSPIFIRKRLVLKRKCLQARLEWPTGPMIRTDTTGPWKVKRKKGGIGSRNITTLHGQSPSNTGGFHEQPE